ADSNLEEDEEDPKEDPIDYPANRGDDDDDEEDDDNDVDEDEDEEEEEHLASAYSVPPPVHRVTARMSIRDDPPTPFWSEEEIARLLAIPSPPPSPISLWSSPLPQIPSPPLPVSPPLTVSPPLPISPPPLPASPTYPLGFRAAMIRQRAEDVAPSTYILASRSETPPSGTPPLLPISLLIPSLPLLLPSNDCRADRLEVCLPPRKRLCIALGPRYEVGESSSAPTARPTGGFRADYGFVAILDDETRRDPKRYVGYGITDAWDDMDTDEIYVRMDDAHDDRSLMSGRLNMLFRDRRAHARTALLIEIEARLSHEDCSLASSRLRSTGISCKDTKTCYYSADTVFERNGIKKNYHSPNPADKPLPATSETNAQLNAMIDQGVTDAMADNVSRQKPECNDSHNRELKLEGQRCLRYTQLLCGKPKSKFPLLYSSADLKKKMTDKYYPRGEIKKLEAELWNLKVKESDKIERYVGGLPDMIHGSVVASKPKTMQESIEIATELMDKKICTFAERQTKNKRKHDDNQQQQRQENKRQNTGRAYTAGSSEKKPYEGSKPLCAKCNYHHNGPMTIRLYVLPNATSATELTISPVTGHFKRDCPKLKNNNRGNQGGNGNAPAKVYAVGRAGTNPDSNTIRGCTLNLLNHPFNIDLMLVELGSLDVIIGMDWLEKYQAVIVCAEKIIRIPWGNETLIVRGDKSDRGNETRLNIISCTKTQKYILKGCPIFLAHVTRKETEDKSEKKRLEDILILKFDLNWDDLMHNFTKVYVAMMRDVAPSTYILASRSETPPSGTLPLLPIPLPTSSSPLLLPSIDRRANKPEVCLPPRKRLCIALGPRYEVDESSSAPTARPTGGFRADYSFVATLDDEIRHDLERDDTDEIYGRLDDTQDARAVLSGRLNLLQRDRPSHDYTTLLMKRETRLSHEAWRQSMDASDTVRSEVRALRTTVLAQQTEMAALRAVIALQGQQGPASGLAQPEIPKEAGSSS
ncbi:putative reverse transcriptase domain-containing protein, partial [Tanacetum coccineum]